MPRDTDSPAARYDCVMGLMGFLEKRRHARVPGSVVAEFRVGQSAPITTFASNFSTGGLFVITSDPPGEGHAVSVILRPPGASAIELSGVVAWVSRFRAAPGFGVQLSEADTAKVAADETYQALLRASPT